MNNVKLQHYIPQFYLKKFGHKRSNKQYWLYCFDKTNTKIIQINTSRIGAETYFYDVPHSSTQVYEDLFRHYEGKFSVLYKKIIKYQDIDSLCHNERVLVSIYVALQEVRTREFRERLRSNVTEIYSALLEQGIPIDPNLEDEIINSMSEDSLKERHLKSIGDTPEFASYIYSMKWILLQNRLDLPLFTSDNPVVRFNPIDHGFYGNLGYLSRGIRLHFPLTPKLTMIFCDPTTYYNQPTINYLTKKDHVIFENSLQVVQATRHLFSISPDFRQAEKILAQNPELRKVKRKRHKIIQ